MVNRVLPVVLNIFKPNLKNKITRHDEIKIKNTQLKRRSSNNVISKRRYERISNKNKASQVM